MSMRLSSVLLSMLLALVVVHTACAAAVPGAVSTGDLAELGTRYGADRRLSDAALASGQPLPRSEAAGCLLSLLEKALRTCEREGGDAVGGEDRERMARLHAELRPELEGMEGYQTLRESVEKMLVRPELPPFLLKAGINGFLRGEGSGNFRLPDFSYAGRHGEGRFLYRAKPYAYWHPADYLDIHLEGQGYGYRGGSQEYGRVSLYQGFVEGKLPGSDLIALKVGRQEFSYGSTFILGANSFYDGLVYDAVRLRLQPVPALTVDLLGGLYGTPFGTGLKGNLAGLYASYRLSEDTVIEVYGINDTGSADHHGGEHRTTWGMRGTAELGPVEIEFEPVFQTGRVFNPAGGNGDISAYGGHLDASLESTLGGRKNKFLVGYAIGSGDREAANGTRLGREFRNPANDSSVVGDMNVVGDLSGITVNERHSSGIHNVTVGWGIDITKELNVTATGHYFLAHAAPDGVSRNIGLETDFIMTYALNDSLSLLCAYDHFFTGSFFRDASGNGDDIHYGYVMLQFDLSKAWPRVAKR